MTPERIDPQNFGPVQETDLKEHALPPSRLFRHRSFDFYVDEQRAVTADGTENNISRAEVPILVILCANPGRILSRETILQFTLNLDIPFSNKETRVIDVHISKLRKKIGDTNPKSPIIETVISAGYKLNDPDRTPCYQIVDLASQEPKPEEIYKLHDFDFNVDGMYIRRGQAKVDLGKTEARLLAYLAKNRNRVVKNVDTYVNVWCDKVPQDTPSPLRANIYLLRSKLRELGLDGKEIIQRKRAEGYILVDETAPINQ